MMDKVSRALDALIVAGDPFGGLFPSLLDRRTGAMLSRMPPAIPGQRNGDRAHLGCNLIHDEVTLKTLYALAAALGRPDYSEAADRYLWRFATHCTDTASGLFPWGEHSFWHLTEDRIGSSYDSICDGRQRAVTHDHLRQVPLWLWHKLWQFNPRCVQRFAEGLNFHWQGENHGEYFRHAHIGKKEYPKLDLRSCDFPRHSGFYILDWSYAWKRTGRNDFLQQIHLMMDYWWDKRDNRGLLLIESRSPPNDTHFHGINSPAQTLSLAASLLESAVLLENCLPEMAATMRDRAHVYIDGFFNAPHNLEKGIFASMSRRDDNSLAEMMPVWGSQYGVWPASYVGLICLCAYRLSGDSRLLEWASAVGGRYCEEPFPVTISVPAMDAGLGLGLEADLYDITGMAKWREGAMRLAEKLTESYLDAALPRGASGIDWYESQMGPGFLIHALARTALLAEGRSQCVLAADYTAR